MKKITFTIFLAILTMTSIAQIEGSIVLDSSRWSSTLHLIYIPTVNEFFSGTNKNLEQSVRVSNGRFRFEKPAQTGFYKINLVPPGTPEGTIIPGGLNENYFIVYAGPDSKIELKANADSLKTLIITADSRNQELDRLQKKRFGVNRKLFAAYQHMASTGLKASADSIQKAFMHYAQQQFLLNNAELLNELRLIQDPLARLYVLFDVFNNGGSVHDLDKLEEELKNLPEEDPYVQNFKSLFEETKYTLPPGSFAPDVQLTTGEGKKVRLHEINGSVILLDFWASWCVPCIQEMKLTIKPLLEKYKERNFVVVSVSFDEDREKWQRSIAQHGFHWAHFSDLLGTDSPVWTAYRIKSLPTAYLLNDKKQIIAKDVRGHDLENFLQMIYNK